MPKTVDSTSDERTLNNSTEDPMRFNYRVLTDDEKAAMKEFKILGAMFISACDLEPPSREIALAKTKIEEAVMWAVKAVTK